MKPKGMSGWPFWVGGIVLGLVNIGVLYLTARPVGIVTGLMRWSTTTIIVLGLFAGALAASLLAGELRFTLPGSARAVLGAVAGGLLMGYGTRLAMGCNVSGAIGGITSFSLHGWVYLAAMALGALVGITLLRWLFRTS